MDNTLELLKQTQEWKRLAGMALIPAVREALNQHRDEVVAEIAELRAAHLRDVLGNVFGNRESG